MSENLELRVGEFRPGERWAVSDRYLFQFTSSGNLELRNLRSDRLLWESRTAHAEKLAMQEDGNLVIYAEGDCPLWASDTVGHPGAFLSVQKDGNVVIYSGDRKPLWATGTRGG